MTDIQRRAVTKVITTYVEFNDDYDPDGAADNNHIEMALYRLFVDNILTPEELSREIRIFTGVSVSPHMLKYAAQGIFINVTKGGLNNG